MGALKDFSSHAVRQGFVVDEVNIYIYIYSTDSKAVTFILSSILATLTCPCEGYFCFITVWQYFFSSFLHSVHWYTHFIFYLLTTWSLQGLSCLKLQLTNHSTSHCLKAWIHSGQILLWNKLLLFLPKVDGFSLVTLVLNWLPWYEWNILI